MRHRVPETLKAVSKTFNVGVTQQLRIKENRERPILRVTQSNLKRDIKVKVGDGDLIFIDAVNSTNISSNLVLDSLININNKPIHSEIVIRSEVEATWISVITASPQDIVLEDIPT